MKSPSLKITGLYERKQKCSLVLGILFLIDTIISSRNNMEIILLNCTQGNSSVLIF